MNTLSYYFEKNSGFVTIVLSVNNLRCLEWKHPSFNIGAILVPKSKMYTTSPIFYTFTNDMFLLTITRIDIPCNEMDFQHHILSRYSTLSSRSVWISWVTHSRVKYNRLYFTFHVFDSIRHIYKHTTFGF